MYNMMDWTVGPGGKSNSSDRYLELVEEVRLLILGDAHTLIAGRAEQTARLIVSQLAHQHHLEPKEPQHDH